MISTTGFYFDGISSKPQQVQMAFNDNIGQLTFDVPINQTTIWSIDDFSIDQIGHTMTLSLGKQTIEHIKIDDRDFANAVNHYLKSNGKLHWYQKLIKLDIKAHIAIALGILGLIALAYFYVLPWVGEKAAVLVPESYDIQMGEAVYGEYVTYNTVDSAKTETLNKFAQQLKLNNSKQLHFTVIESDMVNAFALPDGNVIVFTGIIDKMEGYDELVGLIGHEVVHVNERHSMKMMCRNLAGYIFISAILNDVNGIMAVIGDNVRNLQSLSYSRQFEREADFEGVDLMIQNNVDPKGMTNLFKRLQIDGDNLIPQFLSSHPITDERIDYINKTIDDKDFKPSENPTLKDLFVQLKGKS